MSDKNTREEKLKMIFAAYPDKTEIFMASDDRAFFTDHQADAYGQGLKDRNVKRYERPEMEEVEDLETDPAKETVTGDATGDSLDEVTDENANLEKVAEGDAADEAVVEGESEEVNPSTDTAESDETSKKDEREVLSERYEELLGKKPTHNMKLDTIKAKIAAAITAP